MQVAVSLATNLLILPKVTQQTSLIAVQRVKMKIRVETFQVLCVVNLDLCIQE